MLPPHRPDHRPAKSTDSTVRRSSDGGKLEKSAAEKASLRVIGRQISPKIGVGKTKVLPC
jgi:hypothetical protein